MQLSRILLSMAGAGLVATLSGCGSSETGSAGVPHFTPDYNAPQPGDFSGQVVDGYLRNATVWIDINGNKQWDEGLEPKTTTGAQGRFTFTKAELITTDGAAIARPWAYPLVVQVSTDTIDEETGRTVDAPYILSAPPTPSYVKHLVSPFTTLLAAQDDFSSFDVQVDGVPIDKLDHDEQLAYEAKSEEVLASDLDTNHNLVRSKLKVDQNLMLDYVTPENPRMKIYAKALVRSLQSAFANNSALAGLPTTEQKIESVMRSAVNQSWRIIQRVDAAAGDNATDDTYRNLQLADVPDTNLILLAADPWEVATKKIYVNSASFKASMTQLPLLEGAFPYTAAADLAQIQTYGYDEKYLRRLDVTGNLTNWKAELRLDHPWLAANIDSSGLAPENLIDWGSDFYSTIPFSIEDWFPSAWAFVKIDSAIENPITTAVDLSYQTDTANGNIAVSIAVDMTDANGNPPDGVADETWSQNFNYTNACSELGDAPGMTSEVYPGVDNAVTRVTCGSNARVTDVWVREASSGKLVRHEVYNYGSGRLASIDFYRLDSSNTEVHYGKMIRTMGTKDSVLVIAQDRYEFDGGAYRNYCKLYSQQTLGTDNYPQYVAIQLDNVGACNASKASIFEEYEYKHLSELLVE